MKVIACVNDKGGSCKTSAIMNLASIKAKEGKKVLIIDMDNRASLTQLFKIDIEDGEDTITKLLQPPKNAKTINKPTEVEILKCIQTVDTFTEYTKGNTNLCIIPADYGLTSVEKELSSIAIGAKGLKQIIDTLKQSKKVKFDYIFIDCPGSLNYLTINALVATDLAIVPCEPTQGNYVGLDDVFGTIAEIKEYNLNDNLKTLGVLVSRVKRRKSEKALIEKIGKKYKIIGMVKESADMTRNEDKGVAVVVSQPSSQVANDYYDVAKKI